LDKEVEESVPVVGNLVDIYVVLLKDLFDRYFPSDVLLLAESFKVLLNH